MQISKLIPNPTVRVELKYAPGFFVTLASQDSPAVRDVIHANAERRILAMRGNKGKSATLDQMDAESVAVLKVAIEGIDDQTGDGEPMAFTPENVDALLAIRWVREQLDAALGNDALFFGA